ncbi:RNA polymerase factor sigma-54 [bacterium]|nr:RNA polymerase factor sigma-54 [bacterium]
MANLRLDTSLKLKQGLFLSPEHRQAIELMIKPVVDVALWVQQEINENPFLEDVEVMEEPDTEPEQIDEDGKPKPDEELDWLRFYHDGSDLGYVSSRHVPHEDIQGIEHIKVDTPSLAEHLLWQLRQIAAPDQIPVGEFLIHSLDPRGFFTGSFEETAQLLGTSVESIQHALTLIQSLDPPGVGARDLRESLLIQLDHLDESSLTYVRPVIERHLDDLTRRNYKKISSSLKIKLEKVMEAVDLIGSLNPHPARDFGGPETRYIVPDVFVREVGGKLEVIVNENPIPRMGMNSRYVSMLRSGNLTPEERQYLKEKVTNARWILNAVYQRSLSLYLVARYVVDFQSDFFRGQFDRLRPLTLKPVADALHLSISTISRLTSSKYADTPVGLYELKYFFSNRVPTAEGKSLSGQAVKQKLRAMIEAEDPAEPLSDVEILERLTREGIQLQRRTVAKYREGLGILPRRLRRGAGHPHSAPAGSSSDESDPDEHSGETTADERREPV